MNQLKHTAVTLTGIALLAAAGCHRQGDCMERWEEVHECGPEMQDYIDVTKNIINKYKEEIIQDIYNRVPDEEERKVSPEEVIDLLLNNEVSILCGIRKPETGGVRGAWVPLGCDNGYYGIIINEEIFMHKIDGIYQHMQFLNENLDLNYLNIEEYVLNYYDGISNGGDDVSNSITGFYFSSGFLGSTLVHESTHGAWDLNGFDSGHDPNDDSHSDVFYQYGFGVTILDDIYFDEIKPELMEFIDNLVILHGEAFPYVDL